MGKQTDIAWCDATWNPWQGCRKVSQGCKNCYMYRDMARYGKDPKDVHRSSNATFNMPLQLAQGLRVFVCSWSDFWIKDADEWRAEAFTVMRSRPDLQFLIPTKRVENIASRLPSNWGDGYPNVWLGASVEDQEAADKRVPALLEIPAEIHWLSVEPMLGPVELLLAWGLKLDWVVCGGESGKNFRLMDVEWARKLQRQCAASYTNFFMKQDAGPRSGMYDHLPADLRVREFPATNGNAGSRK